MNDSPPDDLRLQDTEVQMRRALGLGANSLPPPDRQQPVSHASEPHQHKRRQFVRDGQVQVEVVHRSQHHPNGEANPLDAARQNIRALASAKERAERLLSDAQATIKDLQTKLGHERLAKDEAIERAQAERQTVDKALETVRTELSAERIAHEHSEQALRDAQATITDLTEKLHAAQQALTTVKTDLATEREQAQEARRKPLAAPAPNPPANRDDAIQTVRRPRGRPRKQTVVVTVEKPDGDGMVKPARKRGRPPKPPAAKPVKWWKRGWKDRPR